jgi:hypothetical protein
MIQLQTINPKEAPAVLQAWEQEDFYYTGMKTSIAGKVNMAARPNLYLQNNEPVANTELVKFDLPLTGPVQIVYLDGKSDAGLPHTRGKKGIALPIFLLWHPSEKTIQHELVHLSQKEFKDMWWKFYVDTWNFRPASEKQFLAIPEKWRSRRRINPDTLGNPYTVWKDRYIPLSVFTSEETPDLRYCKRGFWDLKMSQWTWEEPPDWIRTFGKGFNDEHPNEIAAHWIDGSAGEEKRKYILGHIKSQE